MHNPHLVIPQQWKETEGWVLMQEGGRLCYTEINSSRRDWQRDGEK